MFVDILNSSMLLSRGVFRGGYGGSFPSWISEMYAFGGVLAYEYASLNIFKTMSSSQTLSNLSKYKITDHRDIFRRSSFFGFTNSAFLLDSVRLCMQALLCCLKLFIVQ